MRCRVILSEELQKYLKGYIFPQEDIGRWLKKHELSSDKIECSNCEELLSPSIPIANKLDRGVVFTPCSCGALPPVVLMPVCPKEIEENRLFYRLLAETCD